MTVSLYYAVIVLKRLNISNVFTIAGHTSVKVSSPLTISISLNGREWKKYEEKRLLKMFLTEEVLMGYKDTDQNIIARSLTLLIFAVGWVLCGRPQPEHAR